MAPGIVRTALGVFFEYDTPRIVHIRSKKVGVINRLIQLVIIAYIVGYVIVYKKGYQEFDNVQSAVTTKVKGIAVLPNSSEVWDVADYVVPPQESNAFFVITNFLRTQNQRRTTCPEHNITGAICTKDEDCKKNTVLPTGNGAFTGVCDKATNSCEINAWCPLETGKEPDEPVLLQSKDFTVFIKNNIEFPKFKINRVNLPKYATDDFLKCTYDRSIRPDCPIFTLKSIVEGAQNSEDTYDEVAKEGGVLQIIIKWNCNFDHDVNDCVPEYEFRRLDQKTFSISKGYNFRFAKYYKDNGTETRTLYKAFGIKYIITVTGIAGKFNIVPLILNFASGIALLSVATIVCDIVVLYILKARTLYKEKKYLEVVGDDAYTGLESGDHSNPSSHLNQSGNNVQRYNTLKDDSS